MIHKKDTQQRVIRKDLVGSIDVEGPMNEDLQLLNKDLQLWKEDLQIRMYGSCGSIAFEVGYTNEDLQLLKDSH